jgi:hypothetical protein
MTRRFLALANLLAASIYAVYVADPFPAVRADDAPAMASRAFEFTYQVHFSATEHPGGPVRLWIPLPQADGYQDVSLLHIDSPAAYSEGRDIRLSSDQKRDPLNYFIYPYAEINGQQVKNLETHFSFRDVARTPEAAALPHAIPNAD